MSDNRYLVRFLPSGVSAFDFAESCRNAARALLEGHGWGKRELALWLLLEYAPLAASARRRTADAPLTRDVREASAGELLSRARRAVRATLTDSIADGAPDWIDEAIESGWVIRAVDEWGEAAWMPVSLPSMRLVPRVLSLLAADYLTRHEGERVARVSEPQILTRPAARAVSS